MMKTTVSWVAGRVLVLGCALVMVVVTAGSAQASKGVVSVFGSSGSGDGQFANAAGTAVNTSTGDVYVVDQFNNRVEQFDASGTFIRAFGWGVSDGKEEAEVCTSGCLAGIAGGGEGQFSAPVAIAVDQTDGSLYVLDQGNNRVQKFSQAGVFVSKFGSEGSEAGQLSFPTAIAVDPTDRSVLVSDSNNNRVERFDKAGVFVSAFGWGVVDGKEEGEVCTTTCQAGIGGGGEGQYAGPGGVAVDSTGRVYVLDQNNGRIERSHPDGTFDEIFDPTDVLAPQQIAIGPSNDNLYVAQWAPDFSEQRVIEIDSSGTLIDTHGVGSTANNSSGLALSPANQKIYLADGFNARVFILDDVTAPSVTIEAPTGVTSTSASVAGTVNPEGNPGMGWRFEISTDDANWTPLAADQDPGSGSSPVPVSQSLTGLVPNTTYFVRLVAQRAFNARVISSIVQFTTAAVVPDVSAGVADDVTPDHAVLTGLVHPHNSVTTYFFEYGTTSAYGASVPVTQDGDAGSANGVGEVLQRIDGLQPGTTYHYRLVAKNQAGTVQGEDQTFNTPTASGVSAGCPNEEFREAQHAQFLPECRAYERVSPSDKNGGDVMGDAGRTQIATDGSAARFSSLVAFGDAIGTSVASDYVGLRGPTGWATHAITPSQAPTTLRPLGLGFQSLYLGLSADLSEGVFVGWSPVTNDPNVAKVMNLYLRDDPKTPGVGLYRLLSACPLCAATNSPLPALPPSFGAVLPRFEGASTDFGHVIFGSQQPLTSDAPSGCTNLADVNQCPGNLYEWDHGTLRLAGILPDNACGTPPCPAHGSQAGQDAGAFFGATVALTPHVISADGSRIFFTAPDAPRSPSGALFMRVNHTTTVQLNSSERISPDPNPGQPAKYWDASTDGQRVFFTTGEALTDDAPTGGTNNLYMYDASKPDSDPHNLTLVSVDSQPADGGDVINVQGVSRDGHYIYFAAAGQLVAGQPVLDRALYVWHDGTIRYIADMHEFTDNIEDTNTNSWTFFQPTARVTPNGLHLLFSSSLPGDGPTGYDQGHCRALSTGCRELYLYDYESQRLACVSCNPSGAPALANAFVAQRANTGASTTSPAQNHPLSDDGRHVFFSTGEALVPEDVNGKVDVYEYDAPSGTVHLLTTGTERTDSYFMDASPSGDDVLLVTRAQLVGADTDNSYDLYDARVGGGFSEPPPPPVPCSGDSCQGLQLPVPQAPNTASSLFSGTGNLTPAAPAASTVKPKLARCRRGYVRRKVKGRARCVKRRMGHKSTRRAKPSRSQGRVK